jgi:hypothetical protein
LLLRLLRLLLLSRLARRTESRDTFGPVKETQQQQKHVP